MLVHNRKKSIHSTIDDNAFIFNDFPLNICCCPSFLAFLVDASRVSHSIRLIQVYSFSNIKFYNRIFRSHCTLHWQQQNNIAFSRCCCFFVYIDCEVCSIAVVVVVWCCSSFCCSKAFGSNQWTAQSQSHICLLAHIQTDEQRPTIIIMASMERDRDRKRERERSSSNNNDGRVSPSTAEILSHMRSQQAIIINNTHSHIENGDHRSNKRKRKADTVSSFIPLRLATAFHDSFTHSRTIHNHAHTYRKWYTFGDCENQERQTQKCCTTDGI